MTASTAVGAEDHAKIQQLYARYAHTFDSGDAAGWAGCFTARGEFTSLSGSHHAGAEELLRFAGQCAQGQADTGIRTRHWMTNYLLEAIGEKVHGSVYLLLLGITADGPIKVLMSAIYRDVLVRAGEGWLIESRREELDRAWSGVVEAYRC